jgi:hypothetical protein
MLKTLGIVIGLGASAVYFWPSVFNFDHPLQLEEVHSNIVPTVEQVIVTAQPYVSDAAQVIEEQVNLSQPVESGISDTVNNITEVASQVELQINDLVGDTVYDAPQLYSFWHPFSTKLSARKFAENVGGFIGRDVLVEKHGSEYVLYIEYLSEQELSDIKSSLVEVLGQGAI